MICPQGLPGRPGRVGMPGLGFEGPKGEKGEPGEMPSLSLVQCPPRRGKKRKTVSSFL